MRNPLVRGVALAASAVCVALPAAAGAAGPPVTATMFQSTQQSVRVVFRNDGDEPIVGLRQVLPNPFLVKEVTPDRGTCHLGAWDPRGGAPDYSCDGFVTPPGGTWEVAFESALVYDDRIGLDTSYHAVNGPAAVYVLAASGAERGPFDAVWATQGGSASGPEIGALGLRAAPKRPRLGGRLDVQLRLATSDLRALRRSGSVRCSARLNAQRLRLIGSSISARGVGRCSWRIPRATRGRIVRGAVEVRLGSAIVERAFSVRLAGL